MTRIPRLSSSSTEKDPPKFHRELDSFAEERLSEKAEKRGGSCGADTLVRELRRCSRNVFSPASADTCARATRRPRALAHRLAARGESETPLFNSQFARLCHPERSEGSAFCGELQIPRFARDDNS